MGLLVCSSLWLSIVSQCGSPLPKFGGRPVLDSKVAGTSYGGSHSGRRTLRCATRETSRDSGLQSPLPLPDYYELLGIQADAPNEEIRKAYRNLQKKHHPDIVGTEGHAMTLLLNKAYETLMNEDLRIVYNVSHSHRTSMQKSGYSAFTGSMYSSWVGPDCLQGIFVDENTCVGCRECVHIASKTFAMDEATGVARVQSQWADPESKVQNARDACPVNCIHLVAREDLPILEYLIRPQMKKSNGVYGGGWERPANVFVAANTMKRKMKEKKSQSSSESSGETPAQRTARMVADLRLRFGPLWKLWSWMSQPPSNNSSARTETSNSPPKGLFGRSSTSDLLVLPVSLDNIPKTISLVQQWAATFASSSEIPLPMPFRADLLSNGVQLTFITADNGVISAVGSLVVTVEETDPQSLTLADPLPVEDDNSASGEREAWLYVRRQGTTGTRSLPGEGRIVQVLKGVALGHDCSYSAYHLHGTN